MGPTPEIAATGHTRLRCALTALAAVALALTIAVLTLAPDASAQSASLDALGTPAWLAHLNGIRSCAGLPSVTEDVVLSHGAWLHARYMSENGYIGHGEDPARPFFSAEGLRAAGSSNCSLGRAGLPAIDAWATGPFHALGMLDPKLRTAGFGSYSAEGKPEAAALDVIRGRGGAAEGVRFPVAWPGPGATVPFTAYSGGEYPDPLASTGFRAPSGFPIVVQFGSGSVTPVVTESELRVVGGGELEHVVLTETTYRNGDAGAQQLGRAILGGRDAVVLVPKTPLQMGRTYQVKLVCLGRGLEWTFHTGAEMSAAPAGASAVAVTLEDRAGSAIVGSDLTLRGRVDWADGRVEPSALVRLESLAGASWQPVASEATSVSSAGEFSFHVRPSARTIYRAVVLVDEGKTVYTSRPTTVLVRARLTVPAIRPSASQGGSSIVSGRVVPAHRAHVIIEAQCTGGPHRGQRIRASGRTGSSGAYRLSLSLGRGTWRMRSVHMDAGHARSTSAWADVRLR